VVTSRQRNNLQRCRKEHVRHDRNNIKNSPPPRSMSKSKLITENNYIKLLKNN
jgi:hypothetical protein